MIRRGDATRSRPPTLRWVFFVARRHLKTRRRDKGNATTIFSILGIAAGAMTLVAVLSVMNGFQLGTIEDILEIDSYHLRVEGAPMANLDDVRRTPGVSSAVAFDELEVLATGFFRDLRAIRVRALQGDVARMDPSFREAFTVVSGVFDLETESSVVVGVELARALGVSTGDELELVSLEGAGLAGGTTVALPISGVFRSGYLDFDSSLAFVSLETASQRLGAEVAPTFGVKLDNRYRDAHVASRIESALPGEGSVTSWREYNRSIFGALRLEKNLMTVLIGLIFVVVAGNMFQSLRRSVLERTEEIGLLKALGASPRSIKMIFVGEGALIGLIGAVSGILAGVLIALNVNTIFRAAERAINGVLWAIRNLLGSGSGGSFTLFSPRYFYISEVPASIVPGEVAGIFLFAVACATAAALLASRRVSRVRPSEVLRHE